MATKQTETKETKVMTEEERWSTMVDIRLPRMSETGEKTLFVGVNEYTAQLPYGKKSTVPLPVAEVIEQMFADLDMEDEVRRSIPNKQ